MDARTPTLTALALLPLTALGGLAAQETPLHLETLSTVGCLWCEGPEAFSSILAVSLPPDGSLVVLDTHAPMVRVFDAAGRSTATFGRKGEGPGELSLPSGVAALVDGTLLVGDLRGTSLTHFAPDGSLLGTHPAERTVMGLRSDPTGAWVAYQVADWTAFTGAVHLLGGSVELAGAPLPTTDGVLVDDEGRPAAPGLFSAAPAPDGRVAVASGAEYRIVVLDPSGVRVREIRRNVERTRRTEEEIAALEDRLSRGPGGRPGHPESGASRPEVDPLRPHFGLRALAWDGAGRLWARTERGGPGSTVFDVFSPRGDFLGEVRIEAPVGAFTLGGDQLAGVVTDPELGVERVRRWRVR